MYMPLYNNDPLDDAICNIAVYAVVLLSTLSMMRLLIDGITYSWLLNLNLWDTMDSNRMGLVDFSAEKSQVISFDWWNN